MHDLQSRQLPYVLCPRCSDVVEARASSDPDSHQVECVHCHHGFEYSEADVRLGIVTFNHITQRWKEASIPGLPPTAPRRRR